MSAPRIHSYDELSIDRDVAPVLSVAKALPLGGIVIRLTRDEAIVAAIRDNTELVGWVLWVTRRPAIRVLLVSRDTFSRLIDELGLTPL